MALLTLAQQQTFKPISNNWANYVKITGGKTNFVQLQEEVEEKEFKIMLGIAFMQNLQANPLTAENVLLLDGTSYQNSCNETIYFKGLRYVLAFMNFSKYVGESFVSDTFTGMVQKNRTESQSLSSADIKRLQLDAREIALQEWEIVKDYLNLNSTLYPLWKLNKTNRAYTPKFIGIKRTIY